MTSESLRSRIGRHLARRHPAIRTVEVRPPSDGNEASWVACAAGFIVIAVIYGIAFERDATRLRSSSPEAIADALLPYQVFFKDLPGPEQRVFREMQEGATEAMALRASTAAWPGVEAMAALGIPPFAIDVIDKSGLAWDLRKEAPSGGLVFEYVGTPSAAQATTAFLILVQEPDAQSGEKATAAGVDEEHRLLPGGTLLHVTFWKHSMSGLVNGFLREPALAGWQQIRIRSPFEELEEKR